MAYGFDPNDVIQDESPQGEDGAKHQKKGKPFPLIPTICFTLFAVAILAILIILREEEPAELGLKFIPPDAEFVAIMRLSRVWTSEAATPIRKNELIDTVANQMFTVLGTNTQDIDSVTITSSRFGSNDSNDFLTIVQLLPRRFTNPTLASVPTTKRTQYKGIPIYRFEDASMPMAFVDHHTVLLGRSELIRQAIDGMEDPAVLSQFEGIDFNRDIVIAISPNSTQGPGFGVFRLPGITRVGNSDKQNMMGGIIGSTQSTVLYGEVGEEIKLDMSLRFPDAKQAAAAHKTTTQVVAKLPVKQLKQVSATRSVGKLLEILKNELTLNQERSRVDAHIHLSEEHVGTAASLLEQVIELGIRQAN